MRFEFATASRIVFGLGVVHEVAPAASKLGKHVLLVTGRSSERARPLADELRTSGLSLSNLTSALGRVRYRIGNEITFHSVTMAKGRTNF